MSVSRSMADGECRKTTGLWHCQARVENSTPREISEHCLTDLRTSVCRSDAFGRSPEAAPVDPTDSLLPHAANANRTSLQTKRLTGFARVIGQRAGGATTFIPKLPTPTPPSGHCSTNGPSLVIELAVQPPGKWRTVTVMHDVTTRREISVEMVIGCTDPNCCRDCSGSADRICR